MDSIFAVFAWRGDGQYHAEDAIGARYWKRRAAAEKRAEELNACNHMMQINPRGYVVRSSDHFRSDGVRFTPNGRIWMAE